MTAATGFQQLAPGVHLLCRPLRVAGCELGRNVTLLELPDGALAVHSTAAFTPDEVAAIRARGTVRCVLDATNFHDTAAAEGRARLPDGTYFVPPGFPAPRALDCNEITALPGATGGALQVVELRGMPRVREHAVYHPASRTLVIADLAFNLAPQRKWWQRLLMRIVIGDRPGLTSSRLFRLYVRDRHALQASLEALAALEFDRLIVGHGAPIEHGASTALARATAWAARP